MTANTTLSYAVAAILSGSTAGGAYAQTAAAGPGAEPTDQIQTIIVTAQRRTESIQDVPISIQAFTGQAAARNTPSARMGSRSTLRLARITPSI